MPSLSVSRARPAQSARAATASTPTAKSSPARKRRSASRFCRGGFIPPARFARFRCSGRSSQPCFSFTLCRVQAGSHSELLTPSGLRNQLSSATAESAPVLVPEPSHVRCPQHHFRVHGVLRCVSPRQRAVPFEFLLLGPAPRFSSATREPQIPKSSTLKRLAAAPRARGPT